MWGALENMAIRHSLPAPLAQGDSVNSILVSGQLAGGRHMLRFLGYRRSVPYVLRQFYSVDCQAFLRWQNEARFRLPAPNPDLIWPCEEWSGGLIYPLPQGTAMNTWLAEDPTPTDRVRAGLRLARLLACLHREGIIHRGLNPGCVFVDPARVNLAGFGYARHHGWDDLWTDSTLVCGSPSYDAVERLCGQDSGPAQDVYSFGALLHCLTLGRSPFGSLQGHVRRWLPRWVSPNPFPDETAYPDRVAGLVRACLCTAPEDRPTMEEVVQVLEDCVSDEVCLSEVAKGYPVEDGGLMAMGDLVAEDDLVAKSRAMEDDASANGAGSEVEDVGVTGGVGVGYVANADFVGRESSGEFSNDDGANRPARVMVFLKGDDLTSLMMDRVLAMAKREQCAFLFVSLVPLNLPSGQEQLFRGELYRRLGAGLVRCRAAGVLWGLRVFDNVDPEQTARELLHRYRPDLVLVGRCDNGGPLSLRPGFCRSIENMGVSIRACD